MGSKFTLFLTTAIAAVFFLGLSAPVMATALLSEDTTTQPADKEKKEPVTTQPADKGKKEPPTTQPADEEKKEPPWWTQPPPDYEDPDGNFAKCMKRLMRPVEIVWPSGNTTGFGSDEDWINHYERAYRLCKKYLKKKEKPTTTQPADKGTTTQPADKKKKKKTAATQPSS